MMHQSIAILLAAVSLLGGCVTTEHVKARRLHLEKELRVWTVECIEKAEKRAGPDGSFHEMQWFKANLAERIHNQSSAASREGCASPYLGMGMPECIQELEKQIGSLVDGNCPGLDEIEQRIQDRLAAEKRSAEKFQAEILERAKQKPEYKFASAGCLVLSNVTATQKLGDRQFEVETPCFGRDPKTGACNLFQGLMSRSFESAILHTGETNVRGAGFLGRVIVKMAGRKKVSLKNGFDGDYPIFKESSECQKMLSH